MDENRNPFSLISELNPLTTSGSGGAEARGDARSCDCGWSTILRIETAREKVIVFARNEGKLDWDNLAQTFSTWSDLDMVASSRGITVFLYGSNLLKGGYVSVPCHHN